MIESISYDGITPESLVKKQVSQNNLEIKSERNIRKQKLKEANRVERPLPLRPSVVDDYIMGIMNSQGGQSGAAAQIIKDIY